MGYASVVLTLKAVVAELDEGKLDAARAVFATPAYEHLRDAVSRRIEERLEASYRAGDYSFLESVQRESAMPESLRSRASSHVFSLDHRPAGSEHRAFLRIHGIKSIDDIDD